MTLRTGGGSAVAAALGALMLLSGVAQAAARVAAGQDTAAYRMADDAKPVKGAASSVDPGAWLGGVGRRGTAEDGRALLA